MSSLEAPVVGILRNLLVFLLGVGTLWAAVCLLKNWFDLRRFGLSVGPGVIFWKTERGLSLLDRVSRKFKRFWRAYGYFSTVVGVGLMVVFFLFLLYGTIGYISQMLSPGGAPSIPLILKERALILPGVNIPLVSGLIAFLLVVFVHESAHGLVFRNLGYSIKSAGLALFAVIPGAFVEQDGEEFKSASPPDRIRPTSAGPVTNILFGLLVFGLLFILVTPHPGVPVGKVEENTPASKMGLRSGDRITSIEGHNVFNSSDLVRFLRTVDPNETVVLGMENRNVAVTLHPHPENENVAVLPEGVELESGGPVRMPRLLNPLSIFLGIPYSVVLGKPVFNQADCNASVPWGIVHTLNWIFALNMLIALFNLLPLRPLDGGHIIQGIAEKVAPKGKAKITTALVGSVTLIVLAANVVVVFFP